MKKNPLIQTLIYKWDIYYSEIYQRGNLKNNRSTLHWKRQIGILGIDTHSNSLEVKLI